MTHSSSSSSAAPRNGQLRKTLNGLARAALGLALALAMAGATATVTSRAQANGLPDTAPVSSTVAVGTLPAGIAITPDGTSALVANSADASVSVLTRNTSAWSTSSTLTVGNGPAGIAVAPDGSSALVANSGDGTVSVLTHSGTTWSISSTLTVGSTPTAVAITPDGTGALVANSGDGTVSVLTRSGTTWSISSTLTVGNGPAGIAVAPDGSSALVANSGDGTVSVLTRSGTTWSISSTLTVGSTPTAVAITPDGTGALVTDSAGITVLAHTAATWFISSTLALTATPTSVTITPDGTGALVISNTSTTMSILTRNGTAWSATSTVAVGSGPQDVTITPDGATALVTNNTDDSVSVLQWHALSPAIQTLTGHPGAIVSSHTLTPDNFTSSVAYTLKTGQTLPAGLALDSTTGVISGTPTIEQTATTYTITGTGGTNTATATLTLTVSPPIAFTDVMPDNMYYTQIMWLADQQISTGWLQPDGTRLYEPLGTITRDAMAAFLYRLAGKPDYTAPVTSPFTDVAPTAMYYKEICWLASKGISTGYSDGTYRPLNTVNRDAMAAFLYRYAGSPDYTPSTTSPFTDVAPVDQFYKEMTWLAAAGISTGYADGSYRPLNPVARDAMAAFLYRYATIY